MEGWKFWWGIAAFFLGGLATQLNGWLAYRRQRKDKAEQAADALRQRREEFELQHLVEVNQLLRDLVAALLKMDLVCRLQGHAGFDEDELAERFQTGQEALDEAEASLSAQVGYILDEDVRQRVRDAMTAIDLAETNLLLHEQADVGAAGTKANAAYDALSKRVRELYIGRR